MNDSNSARPPKAKRALGVLLLGSILGALWVYGCTKDSASTAPESAAGPSFVHVPRSSSSAVSGTGISGGSGEGSGIPGNGEGVPVPDNSGSGSTPMARQVISARQGGKINAGRHELIFPPGALLKDTEITLIDVSASVGRVQCQLYPEGLVFQKPVVLESDFSDLDDPAGYTMFWLVDSHVAGDIWVDVGGDETPDGKGIRANLWHFSQYAPGKNGW